MTEKNKHDWAVNRMFQFTSPDEEEMIAVQFHCDAQDCEQEFITVYGEELAKLQ